MKNYLIIPFLTFLLLLGACSSDGGGKDPSTAGEDNKDEPVNDENKDNYGIIWDLIWSDEFESTVIDSSKWALQTGNGFYNDGEWVTGWGNNELQYYTDSSRNAFIKDNALVIRAIEEDFDEEDPDNPQKTYSYTSAKLLTKGKFSATYGRFEIRAKLPEGQGLWPAIWMLSENDEYGPWAGSGEIDIMENRGSNSSEVEGTIHYGAPWPNNSSSGGKYNFPEGESSTGFHEYAIEWVPGEIRWYVDGNLYHTENFWYSESDTENHDLHDYPAPFNKDFYLILNLAVGGNFGGDPDGSYDFPRDMVIDYVKVYQAKDGYVSAGSRPEGDFWWIQPSARTAVSDGNLVYNGTFDWTESDTPDSAENTGAPSIEGASNTIFWDYKTASGGESSVSNDNGFLNINITAAGSVFYANQLIQRGINLEKNCIYKVEFQGWADSDKSIMVQLAAGEERGWAKFSPEKNITMGTSAQTHSFEFTMTQATHTRALIEFNMGQIGTGNIYIDNVVVKKIGEIDPDGRAPLADGNYVYNGTFDVDGEFAGIEGVSNSDYWEIFTSTNAVPSVQSGEMKISVTDVNSSNDWNIQLVQKNVPVVKGESYTLSFDARTTDSREITALVGEDAGSYARYGQNKFVIDTTMKTYSFDFMMSAETNTLSIVQFLLANGSGSYDIFIDNVVLKKADTPVELPTVDTFVNGSFASGLDGWDTYVHWDASASITVQSEEAKVDITSVGNETWGIIMHQGEYLFEEGKSYRASFRARSSVDVDIEFIAEAAGNSRVIDNTVSLTSTMQTHSIDVDITADVMVTFKFLMGNHGCTDPHTVYIDDVIITEL
ncbi:MAG: carbohydrate binding domain-containing protein [Spirochaetes bacterium]|nr:carbohydrate binding domain-containing protein [Spirochaetota bacterium]MBN2771120.1 carbohydrate binding domain-containing protein [Spirochaetota bacterium]